MNNLLLTYSSLDTVAKTAAYRALTNATLARTIGAARQVLREEQRFARDEQQTAIDQRNEQETNELQGEHEPRRTALQTFHMWGALYIECAEALGPLVRTKYDQALSPTEMLDFMCNAANDNMPEATLKLLAEALGQPVEVLKKMHEDLEADERRRLITQRPDILALITGIDLSNTALAEFSEGDDPWDRLAIDQRYVLIQKVLRGLKKNKDNVFVRVLRTRSIDSIGDIPLLDEGIKMSTLLLDALEESPEIKQAIFDGKIAA